MSCPNASNVNVVSMPPPSGCTPVEGCPGGPPVECSIADGLDVAEGATTDAASGKGDNPGTTESKLRQLVLGQSEASYANVNYDNIQPVALTSVNQGVGTFKLARDMNDGNLGNYSYIAFNANGPCVAAWKIGQLYQGSFPLFTLDRVAAENHTVQAVAAGSTPLWTPLAGQRPRVMRYFISVTGDATMAAPGILTISLDDNGATNLAQDHDVFVPAVAPGNPTGCLYVSPWLDLGNGLLLAAANNVLGVTLSANLVTGSVRVICCGTEE